MGDGTLYEDGTAVCGYDPNTGMSCNGSHAQSCTQAKVNSRHRPIQARNHKRQILVVSGTGYEWLEAFVPMCGGQFQRKGLASQNRPAVFILSSDKLSFQ